MILFIATVCVLLAHAAQARAVVSVEERARVATQQLRDRYQAEIRAQQERHECERCELDHRQRLKVPRR